MEQVSQSELQCPACAGQCAYSPAARALVCASCGSAQEIRHDPDADPGREFHYHPDLPHSEQSRPSRDLIHQCQTCGGEIVFTGPVLSDRCAYCDGPVVLKAEEASYEAIGLIPFRITEEDAQTRALDWVRARRAAPGDLSDRVSGGRVAGLYAPFWTFDSKEAIDYLVKYRVKSGKNWVTRSKSGTMSTEFDDLLMPASPHVTPLIRDGILHDFDPDKLRPYDPAYLAGFAAERHHQTVREGLAANEADKALLIRNRIRTHSGVRRITSISYKTDTTGIRYRRILLPVWILHYVYDDKPMKVVVCGMQGRTFGERPFSTAKLLGYSAALSGLAMGLGWLWGAAGFL